MRKHWVDAAVSAAKNACTGSTEQSVAGECMLTSEPHSRADTQWSVAEDMFALRSEMLKVNSSGMGSAAKHRSCMQNLETAERQQVEPGQQRGVT